MTSALDPGDARQLLALASAQMPRGQTRDRIVAFLTLLAQPRPIVVFAPDSDEPDAWWIGPAHAPRSVGYEGSGLSIAHAIFVNAQRRGRALPVATYAAGRRPADAVRNRVARARDFVMPVCVEVGIELARIEVHAGRLLYPAGDAEADLRLAYVGRIFDDPLARLRAKVTP